MVQNKKQKVTSCLRYISMILAVSFWPYFMTEHVYSGNGCSSILNEHVTYEQALGSTCDPFIDQPPLIVEPVPLTPLPPITTPNDPTIPDPDPKHINGNPQLTAPPDETATPQDPKPPENNPETIAGHEQLAIPSTETGTPAPPSQLAVTTRRNFYPPLIATTSSPPAQVAAATTTAEEKPRSYDQEITELTTQAPRKEYTKWLLIPAALLILATLSVLIMVIRRPK